MPKMNNGVYIKLGNAEFYWDLGRICKVRHKGQITQYENVYEGLEACGIKDTRETRSKIAEVLEARGRDRYNGNLKGL